MYGRSKEWKARRLPWLRPPLVVVVVVVIDMPDFLYVVFNNNQYNHNNGFYVMLKHDLKNNESDI